MKSLRGKVALVTGAASGIGLGSARRLADDGCRVVVADINSEDGQQAAKEVDGLFFALDVSDSSTWTTLVDYVCRELGGIDIAHLNAGIMTQQSDVLQLTDEQYRRVMAVNVDGVVFGIRAVVPSMEQRGGGAIIVTSSVGGLIGFPPDFIYTATKHALVGLVRALAPPLETKRITLNALCPGAVDTPLAARERARLSLGALAPTESLTPAEVGDVVADVICKSHTGGIYLCRPGRTTLMPPPDTELEPRLSALERR